MQEETCAISISHAKLEHYRHSSFPFYCGLSAFMASNVMCLGIEKESRHHFMVLGCPTQQTVSRIIWKKEIKLDNIMNSNQEQQSKRVKFYHNFWRCWGYYCQAKRQEEGKPKRMTDVAQVVGVTWQRRMGDRNTELQIQMERRWSRWWWCLPWACEFRRPYWSTNNNAAPLR